MTWKRSTNTGSVGTGAKFGAADINKIIDYIDGVDVADPATIDTDTTFNSGKLTASDIDNGGLLTLPTGPDNIVSRTSTDTLVNKTLTTPTINNPTLSGSGGTLTLPAGPDTIVGLATTDTLLNKILTSPTLNNPTIAGTPILADTTDISIASGTGSTIGQSSSKIGFFGATPVVQPAANADTSGAILADLETEVNQIKQLLRNLGLMAP